MRKTKIITKICLIIILNFTFNGLISAQNQEIDNFPCDSLTKTKIESKVMYALVGRIPLKLKQADNSECETGIFSFDIVVSQDGQIISAELNKKHSSKLSEEFLDALITSVKSSSFDSKDNAPSKQKGNITYEFKFKEKSN